MPGRTLVGEALTFGHDEQLLGFCLNNPDEPAGDDFETRTRVKTLGAWIDAHEGFATEQDIIADQMEVDAPSYSMEPEGFQPSMYVMFCRLSGEAQEKLITEMKALIVSWLDVSWSSWEPSTAFVLDCIEDELSERDIKKLALDRYLSAHEPMEFNPSDVEWFGLSDEDLIMISQSGKSVGRKPALRLKENAHKARLHHIDRDSNERCRCRCNESNNRRKIHFRGGRHTVRKEFVTYFAPPPVSSENVEFSGPIPSVDAYGTVQEPWWVDVQLLVEALIEAQWFETDTTEHFSSRREFGPRWSRESSWDYFFHNYYPDYHDDLYDEQGDDLQAQDEGRYDGSVGIFEDYGADGVESDDFFHENFDVEWERLHFVGAKRLIRRGTPRHHVRLM